MLYLLTFTCYGSHLPGDARGSFDHLRRGERRPIDANPGLEAYRRRSTRQAPYVLESAQARSVVRSAIVEVCAHRCWFLHALHVRTNHVHGIVDAEVPFSRVFGDWKAYASRALRAAGQSPSDRLFWTHGGSARRILSPQDLDRALRYVLLGQGRLMETYCADPRLVTPP
jgi:REP element-mobilizing transposase RayT